jgi:hypothetical protein
MRGDPSLSQSLALAAAGLRAAPATLALSEADDPLRLNLPPLPAEGAGLLPDAATMRTLAALYLQAELEQAGIIPAAEVLAGARDDLVTAGVIAAGRLEEFARRARAWYDRNHRDLVFARVFGVGEAATNEAGSTINRDFLHAFAAFCLQVVRYGRESPWGPQPDPALEADLRLAARDVLLDLGPRQFGNALFAARTIQDQLQQALELLESPAIEALFQSRGLSDTLRKLYGPDAPDFGLHVRRGQAGQHLMEFLAPAGSALGDGPPHRYLLSPDSPAFSWAATWLQSYGIGAGGSVAARREAELVPA